ncbi:hypothetical protein FKQ60_01415 [Vibrio sp. A11]|nr:hypothetical protein [Vibrio sp. A14(2019)]NNN59521.1 hypothetical protein [Vibrio sp. A11]
MYYRHRPPAIPFLLEAAGVLATFVHPNHRIYLCSWGLTPLAADLQLQVVWVYMHLLSLLIRDPSSILFLIEVK